MPPDSLKITCLHTCKIVLPPPPWSRTSLLCPPMENFLNEGLNAPPHNLNLNWAHHSNTQAGGTKLLWMMVEPNRQLWIKGRQKSPWAIWTLNTTHYSCLFPTAYCMQGKQGLSECIKWPGYVGPLIARLNNTIMVEGKGQGAWLLYSSAYQCISSVPGTVMMHILHCNNSPHLILVVNRRSPLDQQSSNVYMAFLRGSDQRCEPKVILHELQTWILMVYIRTWERQSCA